MKQVALSMIVKDDTEKTELYRCLSSIAAFVDGIFITVTGTETKEIEAIAKNFGAIVSKYKWDKSFEKARNYALGQIPEEFDYFIWTDTDDVWQNAKLIPKMLEIMENQKFTSVYLDYNYEIGEDGRVNIVHPRERILKRGYYKWKGHLHETLIPIKEVNNTYYKDIKVNHYPSKESSDKNIYRNLEILENTYKEEGDKHDPRTEYYLARNYFDIEQYDKAEKLYLDYLEHSGWDEERAMACNYLGLIYMIKKEYDLAKAAFLNAVSEKPNFPTWYVNLAYLYALQQKWDDATHYARLFVNTPMPKTSMVQVSIDDEMRYYETIFLVAMGKRKVDEALEAAQAVLTKFPKNETYKKRVQGIVKLQKLIDVTKGVESVIEELKTTNEEDKIPSLLNQLPNSIIDNAYIEQLRLKYTPPIVWPKKSIVYYAGRSFEEWTPDSLSQGLGGSETAIVQLSKEWVKKGYKVTVYGNAGAQEGNFEGVEYKNYYRFNRFDTFDNLIIWRAPWELDFSFKANKILLDLHDIPNPQEFTKERLSKVDLICVKSSYHRSLLPNVTDDKIAIIPNGVDLSLLTYNKVEKDPHKIIYASSYDRGLEEMLTYGWPLIKKQVPEAHLHIYYGWNLFDAVHRNNPERMKWKKKMQGLMSQNGVTEHGRVGQDILIKEKSLSSIHWYGATFEEIDCISVRESAAVGCVPIVTKYAALKDKPYAFGVEGDPYLKKTQEDLAKCVIEKLKNPLQKEELQKLKTIARNESWHNISNLWIDHFTQS